MAQAPTRITHPPPRGADKRAYPRIPLRLAAICIGGNGGARLRCEIRNFCAGGLLLVYPPRDPGGWLPVIGDAVEVRARWPEDTSGQTLVLRARIVRAAVDSAGAELLSPDPAMLRVLVRCAESQRAARRDATTVAPSKPDPATAKALLTACRDHVLAASARLVDDAISQIIAELSTGGAAGLTSAGGQQARAVFAGMLRSEHTDLAKRFVAAVAAHNADDRKPAEPVASQPLSLLGNDELEEWLSVGEIANHVETRVGTPLGDLERRLGHLTGKTIDHQNNPFGPQVFAEAFQALVEHLQPARGVRQTCYQVFKLLLTGWMETLCRELNTLLMERGVLPEISRKIVRREQRSGGAAATPAAKIAPGATTEASPASHDGHDGDGAGGGSGQDLYAIVRDIRRLRQQFGHADIAPTIADGTPSAAALGADEIIAALSRLSSIPRDAAGSHAAARPLRERVLGAVGNAVEGGQRLAPREDGIIDVADTLFASLHNDGLVGSSVQPWLRRLEVPLLKLALHDDTIFTDRAHAAREVVNRIARLELRDGADGGAGDALRREVDRLVDAVSAEEQPDPAAFAKALKKLDLLIRVQNGAYAENLREVIASCEAEPAPATVPDSANLDEQQREWLRRIGRMKVGDWVLFATDPARPQRLRLAWISKGRERYVFVNVLGLKEASRDAGDLARAFASGEAAIIESADEPALDRAQYAMLQNLHRQLLHETTHDALTGLLNRQEFERRLQLALDRSRAAGVPHGLIHLDLAQFSAINTVCGHETGDRVLCGIADLLRAAGDGSTIARLGSDEFGLLLPGSDGASTQAFADRLLASMRDYRYHWGDEARTITGGFGIVDLAGFDSVSELLQAAESSCRAARSAGVNRYHVYTPDSASRSEHNDTLMWLNRIDRALAEGTLELRCQRIMPVDARDMTATPHHREVLLGVTDENGELISPQRFIITAEHYQRMPAIDRWVVSTMLRYIAAHRERLEQTGGFAINLSGCSISDETFRDFLREEIARSGAPMAHVCFEITETAGITSLSDAAEFITAMRETGCRFSLDDFGSGLSSYVYLKNLPVDYLKIDGNFVRGMDENPADYAVVRSITEIGHFMGKKIIAESVENDAVLGMLREIGVDYVQGYAIERPIRLRDLG